MTIQDDEIHQPTAIRTFFATGNVPQVPQKLIGQQMGYSPSHFCRVVMPRVQHDILLALQMAEARGFLKGRLDERKKAKNGNS